MTTDTLSATRAGSSPAWLRVSRARAFVSHLALSATIVGAACALIFILWYPYPYFHAMGAWNVLRILIGVDLVLGPLLTLIVFKPGKPGLKFDLVVIGLVQLVALVYGLTAIHRERPYFTVFAIDRFFVIAERDVDAEKLAAARDAGRVADKPLRGPLLVAAVRPTDAVGLQQLVNETVFGGLPDIERRPEYWQPFADQAAEVKRRQQPLAALRAARPAATSAVAALPARLDLPESRLGFLPLVAKNRDIALVVDAETGAPLDVVDVDPWIGAAQSPP